MKLVIRLLRWFLVPPAAPLGFYLAFYLSLSVSSFVESFCYSDGTFAEFCMTGRYYAIQNAVTVCGAALAAVSVVVFPTLLAPTGKLEVALSFYALGAFAAFLIVGWLVRGGGVVALLTAFVAALTAGALSVLLVRRSVRKPSLQT